MDDILWTNVCLQKCKLLLSKKAQYKDTRTHTIYFTLSIHLKQTLFQLKLFYLSSIIWGFGVLGFWGFGFRV